MTASPTQMNGTARPPAMPVFGDWQAISTDGIATTREKQPAVDEPEAQPRPAEPAIDHIALAEAEAIRQRAAVEVETARIKAEAEAEAVKKAAEIKADAEAEKQRIANERAAMKLEADKATHAKRLAELNKQRVESDLAAEKARKEADAEAQQDADRDGEQQRTESLWKWGARGIYAVGLIIAAPVQFLHFWDPARKFMVAAPVLLEGLALVLALGAAWAVSHRRDVAPYRVGIVIGALIAAAINLYGGMSDDRIGFNAGLIGALASLGGPIVLMAYEHGIAQKADGIPSRREQRAVRKAAAAEAAAKAEVKATKAAAEEKAAAEKAEQQAHVLAEQKRKDDDRKTSHSDVWDVADSMRAARGSEFATEQIWGDAWYRVKGTKLVGITAEIEAQTRAAQAHMKAATECPPDDAALQVESQKPGRHKKDPNTPDGRRFNGGIPPLRTPGDTTPYHPVTKTLAADTARQSAASSDTV